MEIKKKFQITPNVDNYVDKCVENVWITFFIKIHSTHKRPFDR